MSESAPFRLEEEKNKSITKFSTKCGAVALCLIAPFAPLRIAPRRSVIARFSFPDEFVIEEFKDMIVEKFPDKEKRPPLYLLIHSPGGTVASSYMVGRVLRTNFNKIVGFVPHIAASGATIIALSCNELVMGDISRLTGIDPHYDTDDTTVYPLSIVRAFTHLEALLGTKTLDEISYPYQHLVESITAEKYDESTHGLKMVEGYTAELMEKAGYDKKRIERIISGVLYDIEAHEAVIPLERAKEIGVEAKHYSENPHYAECWKIFKDWLKQYYLRPSPVHVIRYCLPKKVEKAETAELKKRENAAK